MNRRVVPKLRFPEFRGNEGWERSTLASLVTMISEKVGDQEITPLSITSGVGLVTQQSKYGREIAGSQYQNYIVLKRDDFAYNKSATKLFPEGSIARLTTAESGAVPTSIFSCFRLNRSKTEPAYFDYLFQGNAHGRWLRRFIAVGARAHGSLTVDDKDLLSMPLLLPTVGEQSKIAACLSSLDDLVSAHQKKLEALRAHKKGLMQQLFPAEGETVPRLRFPEFQDTAEWFPTTVGHVADFQSGGTPSKENAAYWNGTIPWVSAKDMKRLLLDDTEDHITNLAVANGVKLVPSGTLLLLTRGMTLLKDIPICILSQQMSFNQDVKALLTKDNLDARFLAYQLLSNRQRLLGMVDIAGHGTGRLDTDKLKAFEIMLPHIAEQHKIAALLTSIDDQITAQARLIDSLKQHKKGLMQQLFPLGQEGSV